MEFLQSAHDAQYEKSLRFFEAGVQEGLFRSDMDYRLFLEIAHISMEEIMHKQLYKQHAMQDIFNNFFWVMIRGFCTERGLCLLNKAID